MARKLAERRNPDSDSKQNSGAENDKIEWPFFHLFYRTASFAGFAVLRVLKGIYRGEQKLSKFVGTKLGPVLVKLCTKTTDVFHHIGQAFARPFVKAARGVQLVRIQVAEAKRESRSKMKAALKTIWGGAKRNGWFFKGIVNYAAAGLGIAAVCVAVTYMSNLDIAVAVEYNGQELGYIENETVYEEASKLLQQRIVYEDTSTKLDTMPQFKLAVVNNESLVSEYDLVDDMIRSASKDIVESNGVYIDGEFYGAVKETEPVQEAVDAILSKYKTGKAGETVELVKPVELRSGLYLTSTVVDEQQIVDLLQSEVAGEVVYTVKAGDTPSGVAKQNGVSYAEFKKMNPNCEKSFLIGSQVYLAKSEPFMQVKVTRRETYRTETMYQTETVKDSKKSISYTKVTQNGVKGITEFTADVQYVNGVEVGRTVVDQKVIQKVVNQKVVKGTKMPGNAKVTASKGSGSLSGLRFMWPVNGGYVSSPYGGRRKHKGIDIAAPKGTAVYAAEDGVVTLSRWNGSYGYCIIIDHGNGVRTLYGHSSKLIAKVGQKVKKGDLIMLVGTTGRSTGNHCHFEIQRNGSRINPAPYIGA